MFYKLRASINEMKNNFRLSPKSKIIMVIRVVLLISFLVLAFIIKNDISRYLITENIDKAKKSVQQLLITRDTIEKEYTKTDIIQKLENNNYNFFADFIVSNIAHNMSKNYDMSIYYLSDNSRNSKNQITIEQKRVFDKLKSKGIKEYYEIDKKNSMINYALRLDISRDCLACHGRVDIDVDNFIYNKLKIKYGDKSFNYKEGDMIGMVLVNLPMSSTNKTISLLGSTLLQSSAIIGLIFAIILIFLINKYFDNDIIAPLNRMAIILENYRNDFTKTLPRNKKNRELDTIALSFNLLIKNIQRFLIFFKKRIYLLLDDNREFNTILDILNINFQKQKVLKSRLKQQLKINKHLINSIKLDRDKIKNSLSHLQQANKDYINSTLKSNNLLIKYKDILEKDTPLYIEIEETIENNIKEMMNIYYSENNFFKENEIKDSHIDMLILEDSEIIEIFTELNETSQNNMDKLEKLNRVALEVKNSLEELSIEIEYFKVK